MAKLKASFIGWKTGLSSKKVSQLKKIINHLLINFEPRQVDRGGVSMSFKVVQILPDGRKLVNATFDYSPLDVGRIAGIILAHETFQNPSNEEDEPFTPYNMEQRHIDGFDFWIGYGISNTITASNLSEPFANSTVGYYLPNGSDFGTKYHDLFHAGADTLSDTIRLIL